MSVGVTGGTGNIFISLVEFLLTFDFLKVELKYTWCMWTQGLEYTYTMWMERLEYTLPRLFCSWQESNVDGSA